MPVVADAVLRFARSPGTVRVAGEGVLRVWWEGAGERAGARSVRGFSSREPGVGVPVDAVPIRTRPL